MVHRSLSLFVHPDGFVSQFSRSAEHCSARIGFVSQILKARNLELGAVTWRAERMGSFGENPCLVSCPSCASCPLPLDWLRLVKNVQIAAVRPFAPFCGFRFSGIRSSDLPIWLRFVNSETAGHRSSLRRTSSATIYRNPRSLRK
jgi:hypothetical protein